LLPWRRAIAFDHFRPLESTSSSMMRSSYFVQCLLMLGSTWLNHLSLQFLPDLKVFCFPFKNNYLETWLHIPTVSNCLSLAVDILTLRVFCTIFHLPPCSMWVFCAAWGRWSSDTWPEGPTWRWSTETDCGSPDRSIFRERVPDLERSFCGDTGSTATPSWIASSRARTTPQPLRVPTWPWLRGIIADVWRLWGLFWGAPCIWCRNVSFAGW